MIVRENLVQARKHKKFSQRKLGELVGVSGGIIGLYEKGTRSPRPKVMQKLAKALDVDVNWLESKEDPDQHNKYKVQLDSVMELVGFLDKPHNERKVLSSYARLNLALTELRRVMEDKADDDGDDMSDEKELEALRRIELFARSCCDCFADLQKVNPREYAYIRERFAMWQQEKQKFDDLLTEYLQLNPKGKKIIVNTAMALAMTPEYQKSKFELDRPEEFELKSVGRHFRRVREDKGLSLQEVAGRSGLNEGDIRLIEQGDRLASDKEMCWLSYALDMRLTDLLPFSAADAVELDKCYDVFEKALGREDSDWTEETRKVFLGAFMKIFEGKVQAVLAAINIKDINRRAEAVM